jgi:hypothetical protein
MSKQQLYREFLNLFKRWPIDATKKNRDLSELVRKKFSQAFQKGESSENVDLNYWSKVYNDLKPVINNEFSAKYPQTGSTAASGLSREQCRVALSNSSMEYLGNNVKKIE